jgi:hypothetical protein
MKIDEEGKLERLEKKEEGRRGRGRLKTKTTWKRTILTECGKFFAELRDTAK